MKIAIIGSGVVGRVLASIISEFHDVTILQFLRPILKSVSWYHSVKNQVVGLEWSFPNFACRHGSMPILENISGSQSEVFENLVLI